MPRSREPTCTHARGSLFSDSSSYRASQKADRALWLAAVRHGAKNAAARRALLQESERRIAVQTGPLDPGQRFRKRSKLHAAQEIINELQLRSAADRPQMDHILTHRAQDRHHVSQRVSIWDVNTGSQIQGQVYWGSMPTEFYQNGAAHFQHLDWQGTERMQTSYNGSVEGTYTSLPFGDGYSVSGSDSDPYHFAMLDKDYDGNSDSGTDHATFRQYSDTQGRWMSPDPYSGSYEPSNPQSFNRYAYALNNPLSLIDPTGWVACYTGPSVLDPGDMTPGVGMQDPNNWEDVSVQECANDEGQVYMAGTTVSVTAASADDDSITVNFLVPPMLFAANANPNPVPPNPPPITDSQMAAPCPPADLLVFRRLLMI